MVGVALEKTLSPAFVASPRKVTAVRLVQKSKAFALIMVTPSGIVMLVRLSHLKKAPSPMLVTLSGIVTLVRLVQKSKAPMPMLVTGLPLMASGMTSSPDASSSQPVIVTVLPWISCFKPKGLWLHPPRSRGSDMASRNKFFMDC